MAHSRRTTAVLHRSCLLVAAVFVWGCGGSTGSPPPPAAAATSETPGPDQPKDGPPEAIVKKLLEKDMWGPPAQGGTTHTYNYRSLKFGASRKGEYRTDGVPANSDTTVFPVRVEVEIVKHYTDGTTRTEEKRQSYVFFKDEFGEWTYRFKSND